MRMCLCVCVCVSVCVFVGLKNKKRPKQGPMYLYDNIYNTVKWGC